MIFDDKPCKHAWRVYPVRVPGVTEKVCAICNAYWAFESTPRGTHEILECLPADDSPSCDPAFPAAVLNPDPEPIGKVFAHEVCDPAPYSTHGTATCPVCKQSIDKMFGLVLTHFDGNQTCPGSLLKDGSAK